MHPNDPVHEGTCGSFQVKSTQLLTPMFQYFVILLLSLSYTKIYYIKLQSEIVWEPQGVKILTTNVNNAEYLDGHCMLSSNIFTTYSCHEKLL